MTRARFLAHGSAMNIRESLASLQRQVLLAMRDKTGWTISRLAREAGVAPSLVFGPTGKPLKLGRLFDAPKKSLRCAKMRLTIQIRCANMRTSNTGAPP